MQGGSQKLGLVLVSSPHGDKDGPTFSMYMCVFMCVIFCLGRQFFEAEDILFSARHASYRESLDAGTHCFIMAIQVFTSRD